MCSTSGMAEDAIALLNYVGWTEHRDLHVVGVSLGGMIAQGTPCSTSEVHNTYSVRCAMQNWPPAFPNVSYLSLLE